MKNALEGEYVMQLINMQKLKTMKYFNKNKESSYLRYWDVNNLYSWVMLQKLSLTLMDRRYFST